MRRFWLASRYFDANHGAEFDDHPDRWAWSAVLFGEDGPHDDLGSDLWLSLVLEALAQCPYEDEQELWRLGDMMFDHIAVRPGVKERIYQERITNPKLQTLFKVMRTQLPLEGVNDGWWFE